MVGLIFTTNDVLREVLPPLRNHIVVVVLVSALKKVVRVHTQRVIAPMEAARGGPTTMGQPESYAMGRVAPAVKPEPPIIAMRV
jgi:hypothetical protein